MAKKNKIKIKPKYPNGGYTWSNSPKSEVGTTENINVGVTDSNKGLQYNKSILDPLVRARNSFIYNTITPNYYPSEYGYPAKQYSQDIFSNIVSKRPQEDPYSEDAWAMFLGLPQKNNSLTKSNYRPSISKNPNSIYYSLPEDFKNDLLESFKVNGKIDAELLESFKSKSQWDEGSMPRAWGKDVSRGHVLGNFTVGTGKDDKGEYISYYDKWDLEPVFGIKPDNIAGEPFEIYDRIYLNQGLSSNTPKKQFGGNIITEKENIELMKKGGKIKSKKYPNGGNTSKYNFQVEPYDINPKTGQPAQGYDYWNERLQKEGLSPQEAVLAIERMSNPLVQPKNTLTPTRQYEELPDLNSTFFSPYNRNGRLDYKYIDPTTLNSKKPFGFGEEEMYKNGGIHINPKNKGKFNATKKATGKTTEELTHSKNPLTRKRAIFAQNAAKWNKKDDGGYSDVPTFYPGDQGYYEPGGLGYEQYQQYSNQPFQDGRINQSLGQNTTLNQMPVGYDANFNPQLLQPTYNPQTGRYDYDSNNPNSQTKQRGYKANTQGGRSALNTIQTGLQQAPNAISKAMQGDFSALASADISPFVVGKAITEGIGARKTNRRLQNQVADEFRDAQTQDFRMAYSDSQWGNPNTYIAEHGGIAKYKSYNMGGMANVETENLEMVQTPDGLIDTMYGETHSNGGIKMMLPEGSKILSEKLKHPTEKKSFAKLGKKLETKQDIENLEAFTSDDINKSTAELNIKMKNMAMNDLFMEQERLKLDGEFGSNVKKEAMKDYGIMKNGGEIHKAQNGWESKTFKTPAGYLTPTGVNLNKAPLTNWAQVRDLWKPIAEQAGYLKKGENFKDIGDLQQFMYDYKLDSPEGQTDIRNMWKSYGITNQAEKLGYKGYDVNNLSEQQLKDLRAGFIDNEPGKRVFNTKNPQAKFNFTNPNPQVQKTADSPIQNNPLNFNSQQAGNNRFGAFPVIQPFNEPYLESPIPRFKFSPNTIQPRTISPDFTEISRDFRLSRTGDPRVDANLFSQTLNAKNQQLSQINRANQQINTQADMFNAQALTQNQAQQYGEDSRFRDLVSQMRGNIGTQKLLDRNVANSNAQKQLDYYNFTLPTIDSLYRFQDSSVYTPKPAWSAYAENGGKVKKKLKIKKKY